MRDDQDSGSPSEENRAEEKTSTLSSLDSPPGRFTSRYTNIERRIIGETAFPIDEPAFTAMPRPLHWSVAWSDLMMTMFVLFLCLFVYKSANEPFIGTQKPAVIGGDTTQALPSAVPDHAALPISPTSKGIPLMTAGTIKKVERIQASEAPAAIQDQLAPAIKQESRLDFSGVDNDSDTSLDASLPAQGPGLAASANPAPAALPGEKAKAADAPGKEKTPPVKKDTFAEMYKLSKESLEQKGIASLANVELVPDKTMRIILTSDLLFGVGQSELSPAAQESLKKLGQILKTTPYMINVVGHTDNIPMVSNRYTSNWELSVGRASTVARFLIDSIGMKPNQFVVSGHASYQPLAENSTAANRAKNRRVEIIISKQLPQPQPATADNLN